MTRSGGSGRQPNRPYRDEESGRESLSEDADAGGNSRPARRSTRRGAGGAASPETEQNFQTVDLKKRGIALMCDIILSFGFSLVVMPVIWLVSLMVPHITHVITQQLIIMPVLIVRDYFYQGRGFGKNLMGLQVVDYTTGLPPTILQSLKRNILFFVPLIVTGLFTAIKFLPLGGTINSAIFGAVNFICTGYVILLIPAECWLVYSSPGGRRIGDRIANTVIIESSMDFSKPV